MRCTWRVVSLCVLAAVIATSAETEAANGKKQELLRQLHAANGGIDTVAAEVPEAVQQQQPDQERKLPEEAQAAGPDDAPTDMQKIYADMDMLHHRVRHLTNREAEVINDVEKLHRRTQYNNNYYPQYYLSNGGSYNYYQNPFFGAQYTQKDCPYQADVFRRKYCGLADPYDKSATPYTYNPFYGAQYTEYNCPYTADVFRRAYCNLGVSAYYPSYPNNNYNNNNYNNYNNNPSYPSSSGSNNNS